MVFSETMNRLNPEDVAGSFARIENFIRYMQERIEFSTGNVARSVTAAGVSSAEVYQRTVDLANALSGLGSTVNSLTGRVNELGGQITDLQDALETMNETISDLDRRVRELEGN